MVDKQQTLSYNHDRKEKNHAFQHGFWRMAGISIIDQPNILLQLIGDIIIG